MSDVVVTVVESNTNVTVTEQDVAVAVTETTVEVSAATAGIQGIPGANNDPTYVTVRNSTGATLLKGTIVYISGANGNNVQVSPALATGDSTSARTLGWLAADILNNGSGLCMVEGYLEGLNTQGITAGAQLYLSGTTAGAFTATKPQAPIHLVYVGVATKISSGDGHVFVKVQNGYELDELHNVLITSPTNNQVLAYDSATSLWKNATNAPDGVTSITATAPLTGGTITSTGSIGLDQTALSITKSQVSDFTSGTVTSASTAQQAGTAVFADNSGTAVYATTSGTAVTISGSITKSQVSDFTSGTVTSASTAQQSGTAVFADTSGTATYATTSGTATFADTSGTATFATNAGTAVFATNASTAVTISGSIAQSQVTDLVTDLANRAKLDTANAFTVGGHSITAQSTAIVPLVIKGASGQSGDLLQVQSSDATNVIRFRPSLTNQTSPIANFNGPVQISPTAGGAGFSLFVGPASTVTANILVRGAASTSANLQQWENSAGSILTSIDSGGRILTGQNAGFGGRLTVGSQTVSGSARLVALATSATDVPFVTRGFASQTANLQEWQDSASNTLLFVGASGVLRAGASIAGTGWAINNQVYGASVIPLVVRGAASQSANLQEWQNSAGTVLARVDSSGNLRTTATLFAVNVQTNGGLVTLSETGAGGVVRLAKTTSAVSNPGADVGRIYFVTGTNAGTLKLVVRAGAAGAETTILDNIPQ